MICPLLWVLSQLRLICYRIISSIRIISIISVTVCVCVWVRIALALSFSILIWFLKFIIFYFISEPLSLFKHHQILCVFFFFFLLRIFYLSISFRVFFAISHKLFKTYRTSNLSVNFVRYYSKIVAICQQRLLPRLITLGKFFYYIVHKLDSYNIELDGFIRKAINKEIDRLEKSKAITDSSPTIENRYTWSFKLFHYVSHDIR